MNCGTTYSLIPSCRSDDNGSFLSVLKTEGRVIINPNLHEDAFDKARIAEYLPINSTTTAQMTTVDAVPRNQSPFWPTEEFIWTALTEWVSFDERKHEEQRNDKNSKSAWCADLLLRKTRMTSQFVYYWKASRDDNVCAFVRVSFKTPIFHRHATTLVDKMLPSRPLLQYTQTKARNGCSRRQQTTLFVGVLRDIF